MVWLLLGFSIIHLSIITTGHNPDIYNIYTRDSMAQVLLGNMDIDEKLGQLFMVPVYSDSGAAHMRGVEKHIKKYHIGGVIFMKGHPFAQYRFTEKLQSQEGLPLFIAMDAEWGLSMRLDSTVNYPKQMTMGALQDNGLIKNFAANVAQQMQELGVNVSFSPVVDINSNPENPVIHMRSFGEDKYLVAEKAKQYLAGLQENGILAVAKHFPGHGNTHIDSHYDLPVVDISRMRLFNNEIYPFEALMDWGVGGVMTAHLRVPSLTGKDDRPTSLSPKIGHKLIKRKMGFRGVVFSDALNMKGATLWGDGKNIELQAFKAGNDVLLFPGQVGAAVKAIKEELARGRIKMDEIDESVLRIIKAKLWIASTSTVKEKHTPKTLHKSLHKPAYSLVNAQIAESAITVLADQEPTLFGTLHDSLLLIQFGDVLDNALAQTLAKYSPVRQIHFSSKNDIRLGSKVPGLLTRFVKVVISTHGVNPYDMGNRFGYSEKAIGAIDKCLEYAPKGILMNFGSPYFLRLLAAGGHTVLQCYENTTYLQQAAAQVVYGALPGLGKLPVTSVFNFQSGWDLDAKGLLQYGLPEQVGLSSANLKRIDRLARMAITNGATPGCQVLVAKDGKVIYEKSFGHFTYDSLTRVQGTHIYDLASMTKVMASTLMTMRFYELGLMDLDKTLGDYLGEEVDSNKRDLVLREILTHQSGLAAWIPFYKYTLTEGGLCDSNYCYAPNSFFELPVADNLYVHAGIADSIYQIINKSPLQVRGKYLYSDLGYFYILKILRGLNDGEFDTYLQSNFYSPLGMDKTLFNPLQRFSKEVIAPTEDDKYFRHQLVHGYVHDPAAAMLGGIAGHAGLFSTAGDVAKLFEMFLRQGNYNGVNYLEPETIALFTQTQYPGNRKGLGFDKPETRAGIPSPLNKDASPETYGHTGFTGTCVWADPKHHLLYVFLSNRVYPSGENWKLLSMNTRTDILQVVYDDLLGKIK
ncbi:MAG: serine hydrolase [Bacteroidetes bacterium]|nr:serine hydrolase [Bacteroidota bacterium]